MLWPAAVLALLSVDPAVPWYTVESPHFRVHYHDGPNQHDLAQRVARTCESAHAALVPLIEWAPKRKTDVILTDDVDGANGSANAFLRPVVTAYADVPDDASELNDYEDYVWDLLSHEYTHILHLDTTYGAPAVLDFAFGKLLTPNAYTPRWMTEGLAVYEESNVSSTGRNRSALYDMELRASFLERGPFRLDETTHVPTKFPRGGLAYLYGGRFMRYVAERVGEEKLPGYFAEYGSRVLPWALNATANNELNVDLITLYDDWQKSLLAHYRAQAEGIARAGETKPRVLTRAHEGTGQPHFTRDGARIVYFEGSADRRPAIRSMAKDGSDDRLELQLLVGVVFDLSPDDRRVVYAASDNYREFDIYDDLYEATLGTGEPVRRLTYGLRATEPTYAPDGERIAFVARAGSGATWLGLYDPRTQSTTHLVEASADERIFTPDFTADGGAIIYSQQHGSSRAIRRFDLQTRTVSTVVEGPFMCLEPRALDDGRVLATCDRSGVYNLYDVTGGEPKPLTNFITGAFHPNLSPDGALLAFDYFGADGFDVGALPVSERFTGELPARDPRPERVHYDDARVVYPVRPYSPAESLLPQYWLPLAGADPRGLALGVVTSGADLIGRHQYALDASYGLASGEPSVSLGYSTSLFWPSIDVSAYTAISQASGYPVGLYDRVWSASAASTFSHYANSHFASTTISYELRLYDPHTDPSWAPDARQPHLPLRGTTGTLSLSWFFSNARGFANSISSEEGNVFGISLRRSGPETGGTFTFASAQSTYQTYLKMPWAEHHVLALRLAGGAAIGDVGGRRVFQLGGIALHDPVLELLFGGGGVGPGALRGYPPGAFGGNAYVMGSVEYRFPIADVDRGLFALPVYLRRVHGLAFSDAGSVGPDITQLGAVKPSVGVELQADVILGYYLGTQLRLGYARGLAQGGVNDLYLTFGSSF